MIEKKEKVTGYNQLINIITVNGSSSCADLIFISIKNLVTDFGVDPRL